MSTLFVEQVMNKALDLRGERNTQRGRTGNSKRGVEKGGNGEMKWGEKNKKKI